MFLAYEKDLDLVLVNPNSSPPITKLMDYDKELYQQEKIKRKQRAKQHTLDLKEIKLSIKIDKHDLETKAKRARKFLKKGHKVRILIILRGRENLFKDKVDNLIEKFRLLVEADYEQKIKRDKNRFNAILTKKK